MNPVINKTTKILFIIFFFIIAVSAFISGYVFFQNKKNEIKDERYHDLQAISLLKINQLVQWNKERLSEVRFFSGNLPYSFYTWQITEGNEKAKRDLRKVLTQIMTFNRYENIILLDRKGQLLFSVDSTVLNADSSLINSAENVFTSKEILTKDFYICNYHNKMHFDILSPVFNIKKSVIAIMIFRINPNDYLNSVIQEWPTQNKTAESYLLKFEEDTVYYLNNLRHSKIKQMKGIEVKKSDRISIKAALGIKGMVEDTDYHGKKVIADINIIPGTDWYIITKIDNDEIYSDIRKQSIYFAIFILLSVLLVGIIAIWIYHYHQRNVFKELYDNSKRLEKKIKESEEYQRSIISCTPIPLLGIDMEGKVQIWNKAAENVFEWKANEVIGKPVPIISEAVRQEFDLLRGIVSKGEIISGREIIRKKKDGTEVNIMLYAAPVYDQKGKVIAIMATLEDITEQKDTKNALNESLKNYRNLIDGMMDTVWVIDLDGNIIDVNKSAILELGYSKEELISIGVKGFDVMVNADDIQLAVKQMPHDGKYIFETIHRKKDGTLIPVEICMTFVNYQGKEAVLSIARNISMRKRNEKIQQIQYEIARTSARADEMDDLLILIRNELTKIIDNADFYIALYNPKSDTLNKLNFTSESNERIDWQTGNSLPGYILKTGKPLMLDSEEIDSFINEHNFELLNNKTKSLLGVPLMVNDYCLGVFIIESFTDTEVFDIDFVKMMEMIAYELAIVFKRMNTIRDLINAKEKAEESDRLKMAFLSNISHEIRTPMNGILGFLDLMRKPDLEESKRQKFINIMNESGQRLLETINNIVEASEIESRHADIHLSEIKISEYLQYHYNLQKQIILSRGIDFILVDKTSEISPVIRSDRHKIDGIMTNLLNNAIKFTKSGSIEFGSYREKNAIVFYVRDTGVGIPEEKQNSIFDRFIQADLSITRHYEGLGLGLSIVKSYIELLNGQIWVISEKGRGSTFYFSLPEVSIEKQRTKPNQKEKSFENKKSNISILIAEDDFVSYSFLENIFEKKRIKLFHAVNGLDAIKILKENAEISLVLMDIKMPGMNGIDAVKSIRRFNESIPVIAQTAYAFETDRIESLNAGFNDFITKPINIDELMKVIQKYIQLETV